MVFMDNWNGYNKPRVSQDNLKWLPESQLRVILEATGKPSLDEMTAIFGLFLPNVRLNVIHQYLLSACGLGAMVLCLVAEWISCNYRRQINNLG